MTSAWTSISSVGDPAFVLDSWPMVAWLKGQQPGAVITRDFLQRAARREIQLLMSIVNLGEVYYSSRRAVGSTALSARSRQWGVSRSK